MAFESYSKWIIQLLWRECCLLYLNTFFSTQEETKCNINQISQWITAVSLININRIIKTAYLFSSDSEAGKNSISGMKFTPPRSFFCLGYVMNEGLIRDKLTCVTAQMRFDFWDGRTQPLSYCHWLNVFAIHAG